MFKEHDLAGVDAKVDALQNLGGAEALVVRDLGDCAGKF